MEATFRQKVLNLLIVQIGLVSSFFLFISVSHTEFSVKFFLLLAAFYSVISFLCFNYLKLGERFKEIYPQHNVNRLVLVWTCFVPFLFFLLILNLSFKKKHPQNTPWKIFVSTPVFICTSFLLIFFQAMISPKVAYWTASPVIYYAAGIGHDIVETRKFGRSVTRLRDQSPFKVYQTQVKRELTLSEVNSLISTSAADLLKKEIRAIASRSKEESMDLGISLGREILTGLTLVEKRSFHFTDYSLSHWANPIAMVEVFITLAYEAQFKENSENMFAKSGADLLRDLEANLSEVPVNKRQQYKEVLARLKNDFMRSQTFREIASTK